MRTITTKTDLYEFHELSEDAQETAINKLHDINVELDWWDFEIDYWKEKLSDIGFENAEINFTGFWSQGDGASFTAEVNLKKIINHFVMCNSIDLKAQEFYLKKLNNIENWYFNFDFSIIRLSSLYCHKMTCGIDYYQDGSEYWSNIADDLASDIEDLRTDLCQEIYKSLEKEYEWLTSKDAIIDTIEVNEYEFTKEGGLYY